MEFLHVMQYYLTLPRGYWDHTAKKKLAAIIAFSQLTKPWKGRDNEWQLEASSWKALKYESGLDTVS